MTQLRPSQETPVRRRSHRREGAQAGGPGSGAAPERTSGAALGSTVRTTVDQEHVVDGQVNARVVHDVLVNAGVNLDRNDMQVSVGTPRLVSSNLTPSADGRSIVREDEIEVTVVIRTRQELALFVDALAGASVEGTTLTLTPRPSTAPTVSTTLEPDEVIPGPSTSTSGSTP